MKQFKATNISVWLSRKFGDPVREQSKTSRSAPSVENIDDDRKASFGE